MLDEYAVVHKLGRAFPYGGRYILRGVRDDIVVARQPDASFLRAERIPVDFDPSGDFEGAPDLAIEVASPRQSNPKLLRKIGEYLEAETEEAWLIDPKRQQLFRFRRDMDGNEIYKVGDTFETPLFPGLIISVADIFNGGKTQVATEA
jgi:Uma2 family endonuclease